MVQVVDAADILISEDQRVGTVLLVMAKHGMMEWVPAKQNLRRLTPAAGVHNMTSSCVMHGHETHMYPRVTAFAAAVELHVVVASHSHGQLNAHALHLDLAPARQNLCPLLQAQGPQCCLFSLSETCIDLEQLCAASQTAGASHLKVTEQLCMYRPSVADSAAITLPVGISKFLRPLPQLLANALLFDTAPALCFACKMHIVQLNAVILC